MENVKRNKIYGNGFHNNLGFDNNLFSGRVVSLKPLGK